MFYLGVDNGGTTTKAALYDETGREICVRGTSTDMITPAVDFCERDMVDMWKANCQVIREVLEVSGIDPRDIRAIACCGHGKGVYLWGKDGKPVMNGILSADNRAFSYPIQWEKDGTAKKLYEYTAQSILSCQPVSLLAWIRDHRPELVEKTKYIFSCKDYVRFCLTGEAGAEMTDISGTNLLNLHTRAYDDRIYELLGLEGFKEALPPLKKAGEICGYVTKQAAEETGLAEGTPVAGGMFDIDACALAVNVCDPANVCMIAGTWSINEYVCTEPVLDGSVRLNSLFCDPAYYLVEESSPTSAGNNQWFIDQLLPEVKQATKAAGSSVYEVMNEWVGSLDPTEVNPIFLPFILASNVHPNAKGSFIGITANHTRKHMAAAIYEGIVFGHRYHLEKLLKSREVPPQQINLAGGAAHSEIWVQMFADILGFPVQTADTNETGALGCAITAAVAAGDQPDYRTAAEKMVTMGKVVLPRPQYRAIYDRKYALYCKIIASLDSIWNDLQGLSR